MPPQRRLSKPYAQGAGPLPNEIPGHPKYGNGQQRVDENFSRQTNANIASHYSDDSNRDQYAGLYGQDEASKLGDNQGALYEKFGQLSKQVGTESAMQILDELLRIAASEDVNGAMAPPDNINQDGMYGASSFPPPDFGSQQPRTTLDATDGNLQGLEAFNGYPVSAQPGPGPVRNQMAPMPGQKRLRRR